MRDGHNERIRPSLRRWGTLAGIALALLTCTEAAWGQTRVFPTGANVAITQSTAVPLTWILRGEEAGTATSPQGLFRANSNCTGEIFGEIGTSLRGNIVNGVGLVPETLLISQHVTNRAQARGLARFFYCRTFTLPSLGPSTANVTLRPGGSAFAVFSIARVELLFQNQRREITVPLNTPDLPVYADIRYNGSGVLKAQWEVAEPGLLASEAFRVLETVQVFIPYGDRIVIQRPQVPRLPTNIPGEYRVALRILDPPSGFSLPIATYFVEAREDVRRARPIALVEPAEGAQLPLGDIRFGWESVPGIAQYRLEVAEAELLLAPGIASRVTEGTPTEPRTATTPLSRVVSQLAIPGPMVLVAMTPAGTMAYRTRPDQLKKFRPGALYLWRVQALDERSQVVGESPFIRFTFGGVR